MCATMHADSYTVCSCTHLQMIQQHHLQLHHCDARLFLKILLAYVLNCVLEMMDALKDSCAVLMGVVMSAQMEFLTCVS